MDIGTIDLWAVSGRSSLHRASALSKLLAAGLLVSAVIVTGDVFVLLAIYLVIAAGVVVARLPLARVLTIAAYPALFALLFSISRWTGSLVEPLLITGKAMTAAAVMVLLITTTPYPQLFAVLRRFLPALVSDALLITYRSLFILLELLNDLLMSLRLRGGLTKRRYLHNARNLAAGLGLLFVRALALSEQLHDVLRLRGYSGRIAGGVSWRQTTRHDIFPLGASLLILTAVLFFRYAPGARLYNGYFLLAAILSLLAALLVSHRRGAAGLGRVSR